MAIVVNTTGLDIIMAVIQEAVNADIAVALSVHLYFHQYNAT